MYHQSILPALCLFSAVLAGPVHHVSANVANRAVKALDPKAAAEAHPRDNTAVRAFSGTQIKTSDGRCLFVNPLSGDFRANLTPIQIAACGSTDGQAWDVITSGKHNNAQDAMLIVNTLTGACGNVDTRRKPGDQVNLFSCGGRADGSGQVTDSQLFKFKGRPGPLRLKPRNVAGSCLTVQGDKVGIAPCTRGNKDQHFAFGGSPANNTGGGDPNDGLGSETPAASTSAPSETATSAAPPPPPATTTSAPVEGGKGGTTPTPSKPTSVSRDGGVLNPTAVAEAQAFDKTATRFFESVSIQSSDGRCLSVDPSAGDFRENLIPVALVECKSELSQKFDIVTKGKHNDGTHGKSALVVSVLTNGCISFDSRRPAGDQVTVFSCGGRADGSGATNTGQLIPFDGEKSITFQPLSENKGVCLKGFGSDRLIGATCNGRPSRSFKLLFN
ncbi:uncharacterized protein B0I36DRAFT_234634 [Microdochium trichocladiopsis]|uniref:Ricin B lectin domain-containing protein n=1 Tax=Microdochium trichocladiopsis TaxID=1682393 RepID=A0A9P8YM48_9PEZI|nr:uncharacterized protein B0I36DRAFT_234634 [Microdochium trichocladiopsis]KAH7041559.1 hypothetical protein B0I36DRAFT_234634 [Microdochium trichocladiopsis]